MYTVLANDTLIILARQYGSLRTQPNPHTYIVRHCRCCGDGERRSRCEPGRAREDIETTRFLLQAMKRLNTPRRRRKNDHLHDLFPPSLSSRMRRKSSYSERGVVNVPLRSTILFHILLFSCSYVYSLTLLYIYSQLDISRKFPLRRCYISRSKAMYCTFHEKKYLG